MINLENTPRSTWLPRVVAIEGCSDALYASQTHQTSVKRTGLAGSPTRGGAAAMCGQLSAAVPHTINVRVSR